MRYATLAILILSAFLPASYLSALDVHEVHIAFVDEELSAILKAVMDRELKTQDKAVVVLERGALGDGDLLFEQELGYYDIDHKMRIETKNFRAGSHSDLPADAPIQAIVDDLTAAICSSDESGYSDFLTIPFFPQKFAKDATLSTVTFTPKGPVSAVVYIVRSPEMGLQPQLTYAGLKIVLEHLTKGAQTPIVSQFGAGANFDLAVEPGPLSTFEGAPTPLVSQLAAGGAIDVAVKPGELSRIGGSLYIGIELLKNEHDEPYFQSRVSLASIHSSEEINYLTGPKYYLSLHSDLTPFQVYKRTVEDLDNSIMNLVREERLDDIRAGIQAIEAAGGPETKVSLCTSFFTGDIYKDFGRAVGCDCVSMEDYHLIRALWVLDPSGKLAGHAIVMRQSEDPASIPPEVEASFNQYLKGTKGTHPRRGYPQLTRTDYNSVLAWGLVHGRDYKRLPESAAWDWPNKVIANDPSYRDLFYPVTTDDGRQLYLNPFVEEIASDMLRMAAHGDFLREAMVNRSILQELRKENLRTRLLESQTELSNKRIAAIAHAIQRLGARIRTLLLRQDAQAEEELQRLDLLLQDLTHNIDFVGGEKTALRSLEDLPEQVRTVLQDPDFQEVFMPSLLGLADLQCQSPLLTWSPKRRAVFDKKMLSCFLEIQRGYLGAENPDLVNVLELLGLHIHRGSLEDQVHPDLLFGLTPEARTDFEVELLATLRKLKGDFVRTLRNGVSLQGSTTIEEIAENELYIENYNGILHFYVKLFQGHFPLPRVGFLAKKRSGLGVDGSLSMWVRPYKWARNEAGLANHLPSDFILSDDDLLEKLFSNYALQSSILDRCLYKSTLGPAIKQAAIEHVESTVPQLYAAPTSQEQAPTT